jgi:formate hydrogenlyase subunit 3/multisubunit Na+/H+ antiporter MnhD subunit
VALDAPHLTLVLALAGCLHWIAVGLFGLAGPQSLFWIARILFPLGTLGGVSVVAAGLIALPLEPTAATLPLGLPDLPFHVRLDALSAFFLMLLGITSIGVSIFSAGYFRAGHGTAPGLLCIQYHVFLASMALVLIADDAYLFMVAWETMALSSYFLVTSNHRIPEIRSAGFLYLLIAHIGAVAILLSYGVLQAGQGDYVFSSMRAQPPEGTWAATAFVLALFGFGAKAGVLPLHVWLPEAHPAAPSPVSALMSGVMLKTAIYGLLRVTFDLLGTPQWWWGVLTLVLGLLTAVFGVMFAAVQTDMKRLLAYSSIENIGVIFIAIGLAITFRAYGMPLLAALALTAALYHCINHALFKSLLFLATGSVLHSTKERNLGKLGGLIHSMPSVAFFALIGALAISGLPPLNGFVSEWLLLQAFLATPSLPNSYLNMLIPLGAAALTLAAGLAGYVMVKFYGVIFLGQPREPALINAHDAGWLERLGMAWLVLGCIVLGLLPLRIVALLDPVNSLMLGQTLSETAARSGWLFITALSPERASYSPLIVLCGMLCVVAATFLFVRFRYHVRVRRADPWDCGFPGLTPRMQDTAEGFGQPIKQIFEPMFRIERQVPTPFDERPVYRATTEDHIWYWAYLPIARLTEWVSKWIGVLQHGRISLYLLYSLATLVLLLLVVS